MSPNLREIPNGNLRFLCSEEETKASINSLERKSAKL